MDVVLWREVSKSIQASELSVYSSLFFLVGGEGKDVVDGVLQVLLVLTSFYHFWWYKFNHDQILIR